MTFAEHVERYLRLHAAAVEHSTIRTLSERLGAQAEGTYSRRPYLTAVEAFGHVRLGELEAMSLEIAEWQTTLPRRYRYAIMRSLRQVLNAAVRWELMQQNPANRVGANPQPRTRDVPIFDSLSSIDRLAAELSPRSAGAVVFAVETGLRPSEWAALESRHVDPRGGVVRIRQTIVDGRLRKYGKTSRSRRDVPLTARALTALPNGRFDRDSTLLFPAMSGVHLDLDNWRRREWRPAVVAAGLDRRLTPYAMRHTYASFALDAGVSIFELARLMGTSVRIIDDTYGHLVRGSLDRVRIALEERAMRESADGP
jgi:integrase